MGLAGLLLGLGLLGVPGGSALAIVGLALASRLLRAGRRWLLCATIFASTAGAVSACWLPEALRSLGATGPQAGLGLCLAVLTYALPHLLPIAAILRVSRRAPPLPALLGAACACALWEKILFDLPFAVPWTCLGYPAIELVGVAQLASIGGVPLVSAAVVAGADALARLLARDSGTGARADARAILVALATLVWSGEGCTERTRPATPDAVDVTRLVAVQPNLPRSERRRDSMQEANVERMLRYSGRALQGALSGDRLVVWPENAIVAGLDDPTQLHAARRPHEGAAEIAAVDRPTCLVRRAVRVCPTCLARRAADRLGATLILGVSEGTPLGGRAGGMTNRALAVPLRGGPPAAIDKVRRVPVAEQRSSPFAAFVAARLGDAGRWTPVVAGDSLRPLDRASGAVVTLCFEILFPRVVAGRRPAEARVLLNLADDSWVRGPWAARQLTRAARFRAIEQRLPVVRIAQGGRSSAHDARGRPLERLPAAAWDVLRLDLSAQSERRPGEASILLPPLLSGIAFRALARRRRAGLAEIDDGAGSP